MKLKQMAVILVASGAGLVASAAYAEPNDVQPANTGTFRSLDRNGDGYLTRKEVSHIASYAKSFDVTDENRDGKLSPDEFIKAESIRERELAGVYAGDAAVTAKVKTALARELELKSLDVHVMTDKGRVLLSGWVDNGAQQKKAYQVASRVEGVKLVKDGMTVR
jgi:osmotically-inducible protein OsmY